MGHLGKAMLIAVIVGLLAVATANPVAAATYRESFEQGFGGWQPASDGNARDWRISHDRCETVDGMFCLMYFLDGSNDDGTIWVERQFSLPPQGPSRVDMSFWLWNEVESQFGGWQVVAYIGHDRPTKESDFAIVGGTQQGVGWQQYDHSATVDDGFGETIWIAFGISAVWEVTRTHPVDLVEIRFA